MHVRLCSILLVLVFCSRCTPPEAERPPNVLLVMTDDQGWGDVHLHGNDVIDTPVMDALALDGAQFERFYVSPVCAPTRASLLTGRYHLRTGTSWVTRALETMRSEEVTLAEAFGAAGYATGLFGKWHNGAHYPYDPHGQGFDTFFGFSAGHWNNYFDTDLVHNGQTVRTEGFITDVLTDTALDFIDAHQNEPFFAYVAYNAPHSPFQVPDAYFETYKARGLNDRDAAVYGMVENVDDNLGRLLDRLDTLGLAENTIVLFLTDNGPNGERYNGDMKGWKGHVDEGGVRVPLFVRWPGRIEAGLRVKEIAAHIDLLPTLVDLAGIPMPETLPLDGVSLAPLLSETATDWPERTLFTHQSRGGAVNPSPGALRTSRYRLVNKDDAWELYDLIDDPGQQRDLAAENPEQVEQLRATYDAWYRDVTAADLTAPPIPVGYAEAPIVVLPAHEADLHGAVAYQGEMGWANDWVTNWHQPGDSVTWAIDVVEGGTFSVELLHTAPPEAVGAVIRVGVGARAVEGIVREAYDPDPLPSPDRVPRGEVYEKEWAALALGSIDLDRGPATLVVQAPRIPGGRAIDLKAVRLTHTPPPSSE